MQKLHGTERDNERQPATIGVSMRHAANLRICERELDTANNNERHVATPWDRPATMGNSERDAATIWKQ